MGDVINLNQFRKKRERGDASSRAVAERVRHDSSKERRGLLPRTHAEEPKKLEDRRIDNPPKTEETPDAS
jgi:hypothetical protein